MSFGDDLPPTRSYGNYDDEQPTVSQNVNDRQYGTDRQYDASRQNVNDRQYEAERPYATERGDQTDRSYGSDKPQDQTRRCPKCGTLVPADAKHCPSCGHDLQPKSKGPIWGAALAALVAGFLAAWLIFDVGGVGQKTVTDHAPTTPGSQVTVTTPTVTNTQTHEQTVTQDHTVTSPPVTVTEPPRTVTSPPVTVTQNS